MSPVTVVKNFNGHVNRFSYLFTYLCRKCGLDLSCVAQGINTQKCRISKENSKFSREGCKPVPLPRPHPVGVSVMATHLSTTLKFVPNMISLSRDCTVFK